VDHLSDILQDTVGELPLTNLVYHIIL